ncbi:MAG TPA: LCP family protein [Deinococcales bacterium]|nr:LCP family protein [Deinococcales bacterium]
MKLSRVLAARLILLAGTLLAFAGLAGYWLWPRTPTVELNTVQQDLLGISAEDFHVSALLAGRDILYAYSSSEPVYDQGGNIVCWRPNGTRSVQGVNTDTMIYAALRNDELTLISLPRDLFVGEGTRKLNSLIAAGPEVLREAVADILGLPVDHYVVLNLDIFKNLVDDLGGVEVNVPQRMRYHDCAGGLDIDIPAGLQVLDGEQASDFVRFRALPRGDIDRVENIKLLALAALRRLQQLNVSAVAKLPALATTFIEDVETDLEPADLPPLLSRVGRIRIGTIGTLPTRDAVHGETNGLVTDPEEVEWFLASLTGGSAREFAGVPADAVVLTDRTGVDGAADWYAARLVAAGVPEDALVIRTEDDDGGDTRVLATLKGWEAAGWYADLLNVGRQQVDRLGTVEGEVRQLELVLGEDALSRTALGTPLEVPEPDAQVERAEAVSEAAQ